MRRAAAHDVAVAVDAVDAADRRPVLVVPQRRRPGTRRARAGTRASTSSRRRRRPRCAARCTSGLSSAGHSPDADAVDLGADRDHRVDEPVELGEVLGLGRLDHQRARDRERHRRRVEAVVDEPLGDVVDGDARVLGDRAQVDDALVRDEPVRAACRAPGSAARAAARGSSRSGSRPRWRAVRPVVAHHRDVRPRDRQDPGRAPRRGADRHRHRSPDRPRAAAGGSAGTARGARCTPIGPTPGPPPPCGMQNVLCRLRCDTSAPNSPGLRDADERVEVRAVEVHLAAVLVHDRADLADLLLEHAVRRRVRDHQRSRAGRRARRPCASRSSRSTLPWSSHFTTTTRMPAIAALAALVPCADAGIRHTSRSGSPRAAW